MEESEWSKAREEEGGSKRREVVWEIEDCGRGTWPAEKQGTITITGSVSSCVLLGDCILQVLLAGKPRDYFAVELGVVLTFFLCAILTLFFFFKTIGLINLF